MTSSPRAPRRVAIPDFCGRPLTLSGDARQWEAAGPEGGDCLLLGLGPEDPAALPFAASGRVFWLDCPETRRALPDAPLPPSSWQEVTPEQAHRIGLQLCERLFENRYEVVIGTHLDKAHLHNHILVNSVAKDNGAKYHSNRQSYYQQIRRISDELCREEQLSVIEPHSNGQPYPAWKNQKTGKPTLSQMLRDEIDLVIRDCFTFPDFLNCAQACFERKHVVLGVLLCFLYELR